MSLNAMAIASAWASHSGHGPLSIKFGNTSRGGVATGPPNVEAGRLIVQTHGTSQLTVARSSTSRTPWRSGDLLLRSAGAVQAFPKAGALPKPRRRGRTPRLRQPQRLAHQTPS